MRLNLMKILISNKKEVDGWKKFMKKIENEAADAKTIADISSFKYGTLYQNDDNCFDSRYEI